jgi:hypothetical protein
MPAAVFSFKVRQLNVAYNVKDCSTRDGRKRLRRSLRRRKQWYWCTEDHFLLHFRLTLR